MRILNKGVFWSCTIMIWLAIGYLLIPAAKLTPGWQWIIQGSFVIICPFIVGVWVYGMHMDTRRPSIISVVIPLYALFNLIDKVQPPKLMPLPQALPSTALMLGICALGLLYFYGVSFKKAPVEPATPE